LNRNFSAHLVSCISEVASFENADSTSFSWLSPQVSDFFVLWLSLQVMK